MRSWIIKHRELAHVAGTVRNYRLEAQRLEDLIAAYKTELGRELVHLGNLEPQTTGTLEQVLQRCQKVVDLVETRNREKQGLEKRIKEIEAESKEANQAKLQAQRELESWWAEWAKAIQPLGLSDETSPAAVHAVMAKHDEVFQKIHEATSLQARITGINQDAKRFTDEVSALAKQLGPDLLTIPPDQAAAELQSRLSQARADAATQTALKNQLKEKRHTIQVSQDTIRLMTESLDTLCLQAGCATHDELEARDALSNQYQDLQKEIADLETQILELAPGASLAGC
jgi:uncharacterized protein YhaN